MNLRYLATLRAPDNQQAITDSAYFAYRYLSSNNIPPKYYLFLSDSCLIQARTNTSCLFA